MDAQQIAERHVIERYFAGQLSDGEALAFEAYVEKHPEIVRDIEEIARMKAGLASLKKRGDLPALAESHGNWRAYRPALIAASVAVLALSILFVRPALKDRPGNALIASTIETLAGDERPPVMISAVVLSRSRSLTPETLHPSPQESFVQVTLEMFAESHAGLYSVELLQMVDGSLRPLAVIGDLRVDAEGNLVLYAREDSLSGGLYVFRASDGVTEPADFVLRVAR